MKTDFRLNSVVKNGAGSKPECGMLEVIYSFLFSEFHQDYYRSITINQIGNDLDEFISKEPGNRIHCNIRFPVKENFYSLSTYERNKYRLELIHTALLRIADYDNKLNVDKLVQLKSKIISEDFCFLFQLKEFKSHFNENIGKILLQPTSEYFDYFIKVTNCNSILCKQHLYRGIPELVYVDRLFSRGKWKNEDNLVITGKEKEVQIDLFVSNCYLKIKNLTSFKAPPLFTMMRGDVSENQRHEASSWWQNSLPPSCN